MGTTTDKLQYLIDAKIAISAAIEAKGGTVPTELSGYGPAIEALPSGGGGDDGRAAIIKFLVEKPSSAYVIPADMLSGVTTIGIYGLYSAGNLSACIPDTVTSIHWSSSFGDQYGNGTRIIDFGTTRTTIPSIINYQSWIKPFNNSNSKNKIYVPAALVEDWKAATGWADIASHIEAHP